MGGLGGLELLILATIIGLPVLVVIVIVVAVTRSSSGRAQR
jgi:hypothetical protein